MKTARRQRPTVFRSCRIKTVKLGSMAIELPDPRKLKSVAGFGDTVKVGDHVNMYFVENGKLTSDTQNVQITYLGENSMCYRAAYQEEGGSDWSCCLEGRNTRGVPWHRLLKLVTTEQAPKATPVQVTQKLTPLLLKFPYFTTKKGKLNSKGKRAVARMIQAFCHWSYGIREITVHLPNPYYIRTNIRKDKVIGFDFYSYIRQRVSL